LKICFSFGSRKKHLTAPPLLLLQNLHFYRRRDSAINELMKIRIAELEGCGGANCSWYTFRSDYLEIVKDEDESNGRVRHYAKQVSVESCCGQPLQTVVLPLRADTKADMEALERFPRQRCSQLSSGNPARC